MNEFEDEIRRALRVDVPEGMAERILQRVEARLPPSSPQSGGRKRLMAAAAVVVLAAGLIAGREVFRYREGERVKEEVMMGLRVTGASLRQIRERVRAPLTEAAATDQTGGEK